MAVVKNDADTEQSNQALTYLVAGLVAFSESDWQYPYPSTLSRARGLLYGALIEKGKWKFQSMSEFIKLVQTPLRDWWPFEAKPEGVDPDIPLLDTDLQVSDRVEEFLLDKDDLTGNQIFDAKELKLVLDNRKIREVLQQAQRHPELEDAYVALRSFLIRNPWLNASEGINFPREAAQLISNVSDFYEKPSINMLHDGRYWLCPRCKGILIWAKDTPRCATLGLCDRLVKLDKAKSILGDMRTLKMTFRKRVQLPGLPELDLFDELSKIPGVEVKLWPDADRYDLSVRKEGAFHWILDVKDYASEFALSFQFRNRPYPSVKGADFFYVIPDHRERLSPGYVNRLKHLSPKSPIRLASGLLQEAKKNQV
ncbi:MAG TPA: hypothetical protein PKM21_07380 [Anaerolineales bacterium]|nr:hypothetical protein [Anaerolineales bacterium]